MGKIKDYPAVATVAANDLILGTRTADGATVNFPFNVLSAACRTATITWMGDTASALAAPAVGTNRVFGADSTGFGSYTLAQLAAFIGASGGGVVDSIVAGDNVSVDNTDPANPVVSAAGGIASIVAGANVTVDNTDPLNPVVSAAGGGAGTIPADTVIAFPGAYANWAALITYLKANVFTGTVVVNVADGTYPNDFLLPEGFTMPNLRIAFGTAVWVDTTGWAPNLFGLATAVFGGVGVHIGCVHGTVTDATPGGAAAVNCPLFIRSEWTAGYSNPPVEAGEVGLTFDGFQAGPTIIDTITHGAATFSVLGVTVSSSWSGGAIYDVKYITDAPTHNLGGLAPFGTTNTLVANFASYDAAAAGNWTMGLGSGQISLGLFTRSGGGGGFVQVVEGCRAFASLLGGTSYATYVSGGLGLFFVEAGAEMSVHVATSAITFIPAEAYSSIAGGEGRFEISGAGITIDNAALGGADLKTVFTVRTGRCESDVTGGYRVFSPYANQVIAGRLFTTTQGGVNIQNSALPDAGLELIYGGDITFWNHDAGALIATAELRFTQGVGGPLGLAAGQVIGFYSADGITALNVTDGATVTIPGMPTSLVAGVPVFVRVTPAGVFAA